MGRRKKVSTTTSIGMGAAFAASISEEIDAVSSEGENASKALAVQAEKVIFQGYITACFDTADNDYVLASDAYRGYMAWTGKYISEENFRALMSVCKVRLIVVQHEDPFGVSVQLAVDGFKMQSIASKFAVEKKTDK